MVKEINLEENNDFCGVGRRRQKDDNDWDNDNGGDNWDDGKMMAVGSKFQS